MQNGSGVGISSTAVTAGIVTWPANLIRTAGNPTCFTTSTTGNDEALFNDILAQHYIFPFRHLLCQIWLVQSRVSVTCSRIHCQAKLSHHQSVRAYARTHVFFCCKYFR